MSDIKTEFCKLELKSPIIAGASGLTSSLDNLKRIEDCGAGAVVLKSILEEEIQLERLKLEEDLSEIDNKSPEMIDVFPELEYIGPEENIRFVEKASEALSIPVFGSLNAVKLSTWVEYALLIENAGASGIELNFYSFPSEFTKSSSEIEDEMIKTFREVKKAVSIPICVKLSPYFTNALNFIGRLDGESPDGIDIFNRSFEPGADVEKLELNSPFNLSLARDHRLAMRYSGILYGKIKASLCASGGVTGYKEALSCILAGADCVSAVTALYKDGMDWITETNKQIENWMSEKNYASLKDFRGLLSRGSTDKPWLYKRAHYAKLLLNTEKVTERDFAES
ncbi:MAG: dihydroorotate dehydrogenase-like protein [Fibrobacterota bacterium]